MSYYQRLELGSIEDSSLAEGKRLYYRGFRKKKKLDPADFVEIKDGFHTIEICHWGCAGKLIAVFSELYDLPQETWTTASLRVIQSGGQPIKHELRCIICPEGWEFIE